MIYGKINLRLRPIKIAFLIHPHDKKSLKQAIEINNFMWGGIYNPIIPIFKKIPKIWKDKYSRKSCKEIIEGYLDAYEPDYIIRLGKNSNIKINIKNYHEILLTEIKYALKEDNIPGLGIGLFDLFEYFINKELKFKRYKPLTILSFEFAKKYSLFLNSIFGLIPSDQLSIYNDYFGKKMELTKKYCSLGNYLKYFKDNYLFLSKLTSLYIERIYTSVHTPYILLMDASNPLDILDFWNLRALGRRIIPIAKQLNYSEDLRELLVDFIEINYISNNFGTALLKGRNVSEKENNDFYNFIKLPKSRNHEKPKIHIQNYWPRIWDEWSREHDFAVCCEFESKSTSFDIIGNQNFINIKPLKPKFISRSSRFFISKFANDLSFHFYNGEEPLAEVIPEGGRELADAINAINFKEWRFSKKSITYLPSLIDFSVNITIPKAENVFSAKLKADGWETEISDKGHIVKQMIRQLGGVRRSSIIANEDIIKLLETMNKKECMNYKTIWAIAAKIANKNTFIRSQSKLVELLSARNIFRLGVQLQCPICKQHSWYSLNEMEYNLKCPNCSQDYSINTYSPKDIKWAYKLSGPFKLPKRAYGAYSIILTLGFFTNITTAAITPIMSFNAKKNKIKFESDLGIIFRESRFRYSVSDYIFAECKSYNYFQKRDIDRAKKISKFFPGAIIVFATLRKDLTNKEKKLLTPIVNQGRKYWKNERPYNPILILTGTELFSDSPPPYCWERKGGRYSTFANQFKTYEDIIQICDISQQIYLGMKPWHEWLKDYFNNKRKQ